MEVPRVTTPDLRPSAVIRCPQGFFSVAFVILGLSACDDSSTSPVLPGSIYEGEWVGQAHGSPMSLSIGQFEGLGGSEGRIGWESHNWRLSLKFDPRVAEGMRGLESRALDLGLHPGDNQPDVLRERLGSAGPPFFAALRQVQQDAIVQSDIADLLLDQAVTLMATLRAELIGDQQAAS